jgi:hypothetical protein
MIHNHDTDVHDNEYDAPAPQTCPVCQQPLRFFPLNPSAMLDWVEILQEDLATLHDHLRDLKRVVESAVLP